MAKKDDSKDTITNVGKSVVVEMLDKQQSGFVARMKAKKELRTQKDGRLFAIELLKKIAAESANPPFSCVDSDSDEDGENPYPAQSPMIREAFDRIFDAPEEARAGFFVVMTEELGGRALGGHIDISALEKWEAEGRMRTAPETSPVEVYEALTAEKKPHIAEDEPGKIEDFIQGSTPTRRIALAYLARPWREIAENIRNDRDTAVTLAVAYEGIKEVAENYAIIAAMMKAAEVRLMISLAAREDMTEILTEAKKQCEEADEE
jgi:hypothetical protein